LALVLAGCLVAAAVAVAVSTGRDDAPVTVDPPPPAASEELRYPRFSRGAGPPVLGAAVEWRHLRRRGAYARLFLRHYRSLTPENAMKMEALAPAPDRLAFGEADDLVRWARRRGIAVHGHTLVWDRQLPPWLTSRDWTRAELRPVLERYVKAVVRHFRGRVASWDVVNESLAEDGSLERSLWREVLGDGYIADALRWAHEADPAAELYVNDYNIERPGPKADGMFALLADLRRRGAPLDGVGLQTHLTTDWRPTPEELRRTMRRYARLGLAVDVSEMDVAAGGGGRRALAEQARIYRTVAAACRDLASCSRFTTWGFTDASTWLGTEERPLPFTVAGAPKPAWRAIAAELRP
jgi:endo-1,4-beta-xylanase